MPTRVLSCKANGAGNPPRFGSPNVDADVNGALAEAGFELVEIAPIGVGRFMRLQTVLDLRDTVEDAVQAVQPLLEERGQRLTVAGQTVPIHQAGPVEMTIAFLGHR